MSRVPALNPITLDDADVVHVVDVSDTSSHASGTSKKSTISALRAAIVSNEFDDNQFRINDNADATKQIAFEASGITTGNARTLTAPDQDGTLMISSSVETGEDVVTRVVSLTQAEYDAIVTKDADCLYLITG